MGEAGGDRAGGAKACGSLGLCYESTGDYGRARELHEQDRALCEALGDRAGVARACSVRLVARLNELQRAGDWLGVVAREKEELALVRELPGADPGLAGKIHGILGLGFENTGDYGRARELHEQCRAIFEALGDRAGVARACGNLGICYTSTGDYGRARELHEQDRAICEALGDRAGVARACGNLGLCYYSTGDYGRARELHEQYRAVAEALGDRAGWRRRAATSEIAA